MRWSDIWMGERNTIGEYGLEAVIEVAYCYEYSVLQAIIFLLEELRKTGQNYHVVDGCLQVFVDDMVIYFKDSQLVVKGEDEEECSYLFSLIVRNCPDGKDDISVGRFEATFIGTDPSFCVEEKEERQQRVNTRRQREEKRGRRTRGKKEKRRNYRKENRKDLW